MTVTWQEKDIEDYVVKNSHKVFGNDFFYLGRQLDLGVGILDVLLINPYEKAFYVVEIKNKIIDSSAFTQLLKYICGMYDYLNDDEVKVTDSQLRSLNYKEYEVKGILLGPEISDEMASVLRLMQRLIKYYQLEVELDVNANHMTYNRLKTGPKYKPQEFFDLILPYVNEIQKYADEEEKQPEKDRNWR